MNNETTINITPLNASREELAALALPQLEAAMEQLMERGPAMAEGTTALDVGVGAMYLSHGVFMGIAKGDFAFTSGISLRFEGQQWGPGIAVGFSAGQITTLPGVTARDLLGEVQYSLAQKPGVGVTLITIAFRRGARLLGQFSGPAIGVGAVIADGKGTFTIIR